MNIEQLNQKYGIGEQVVFKEGEGGLPFIHIKNEKANALISIYGGQVLAFRPIHAQDDLLFLSKRAYYQQGKAIKGGVPICWPWFGPDPEGKGRSAHGFMRNRMWDVIETSTTPDSGTRIVLGSADTKETQSIWPRSFMLRLEITISNTLNLELITRNPGSQTCTITQAFHTYFSVGDIRQTHVSSLENTRYIDKVNDNLEKNQIGVVTIEAEVDRIYQSVDSNLIIHDTARKRRIRITSKGNRTAVVWNPWAKISTKMADLEDDDYLRFICVETTNAATDRVHIQPGSEFRLVANYRIEQD
ncbi:glucose-6-phosphate 1-epimerase [Nitrosomonas eutropha]|uniref:Putative glucose-6-phosphate 1-epimerase n=1 Tax=Nitrosomonas eutropha TaxID=916 RepID=A0A1I7HN51_9PROT|nr:D-hexose-6-phosphate mutarotase [Nitrosomonas eutropha]SFU61866.1 glucose-6-phosphate 1-epimerase [Nitrosomonas eutropha]